MEKIFILDYVYLLSIKNKLKFSYIKFDRNRVNMLFYSGNYFL